MDYLHKINDKINYINKNSNKLNLNQSFIKKINRHVAKINQKGYGLVKINPKYNVNQDKLFDQIGILDPEGKHNNPLTGAPYQNLYTNIPEKNTPGTYKDFAEIWSNFPVYKKSEGIIKDIYQNRVLILTAGTGSGKTVLVPKFSLHVLGYQGKVVVTNPKKIPTRSAAEYAAKTLDVEVGKQIGYAFRGAPRESRSEENKILYCTDGILVARLSGNDPNLEEFDIVVVDEAHERNVQIDLLLAQLKSLMLRRDDLRLIIMSATIDPTVFINYFTTDKFKPKWIEPYSGTSNLPIKEIFYPKNPINQFDKNGIFIDGQFVSKAVEVIVKEIIKPGKKGDILVFFTGKGEGEDACKELQKSLEGLNVKPLCILLHGQSSREDERWATSLDYLDGNTIPGGPYDRRIVMATEAVESSITFAGSMDWVIDAGLAKMDTFYPAKRMSALEQKYISKASHKQRRGRTGRVAPGTCYNLFTETEYKKFKDFTDPPILVSDVTDSVLAFMSSKYISHVEIPFKYSKEHEILKVEDISLNQLLGGMITPPTVEAISVSLRVLYALGAIDFTANKGTLTDLGKAMAKFRGLHPEMSKAIIKAYGYKVRDDVIAIAAMVESAENRIEKIFDKFFSKKDKKSNSYQREHRTYLKKQQQWVSAYGDHLSILNVYQAFKDLETELRQKMQIEEAEKVEITEVDQETGIVLETIEETDEFLDPKEYGVQRRLKDWCKDNYLNYKTISRAIRWTKDYKRTFRFILREYPDLFRGNVVISEKNELNILRALFEGNFINIAMAVGPVGGREFPKYQTCFAPEQSIAVVDQSSLYRAWSKSPGKFVFYSSFRNILGRTKFNIVSKIPDTMVKELAKGQQKSIEKCLIEGNRKPQKYQPKQRRDKKRRR